MIPSIQTIKNRLEVNDSQAISVRMLMDGVYKPEDYQSVKDWVAQCYHKPSHDEMVMCAINEILECHGVEAVEVEGHDIVASYCNTGETYMNTVVYIHDDTFWVPGWKIMSWGNVAERYSY